ncbi:MAG: response regulator [Treponema sp.]|nr:response regulator [Treponema sp.]
MENTVLFICSSPQSFLATAMMNKIRSEGYEVTLSVPDYSFISSLSKLPDIFIVDLSGEESVFANTLNYIKKCITADNSHRILYIIGSDEEIKFAHHHVQEELISATFRRPVNMTDIISQLNMHCAKSSDSDSLNSDPHKAPENTGKKSLLIVDDNATTLHTMKTWFSQKYDTFIANSGMNAVAFLKERKVDLVLLDYEMPVLLGIDVLQVLKTDPATAKIPVVFLTAKDDKETVMKILAAKPNGYLLKEQPMAKLLKSVDNFFEQPRT